MISTHILPCISGPIQLSLQLIFITSSLEIVEELTRRRRRSRVYLQLNKINLLQNSQNSLAMQFPATLQAKCNSATAQQRTLTSRISDNVHRVPINGSVQLSSKNVVVAPCRRNLRLKAKTDDEEGGNLGDDMLDFLYAGKKLRKW
jgi:hypothetical protein